MNQETIKLHEAMRDADAMVIGAGSGLSTAAGLTYAGERFERFFADFIGRYGFTDMYSAGFYPFPTLEEQWAYWSRHIWYNRYVDPPKDTYAKLLSLVEGKDFFVLTTNVDHQFQLRDSPRSACSTRRATTDYGSAACRATTRRTTTTRW